ncbi:MAG: bifunctional transaldolase/phosoglucose isomerase [Armatimonadota bacterium]
MEGSALNPLRQLEALGQSIWLDYIRRSLITGGDLQRLVDVDGLSGVTINPTIFEKAVAGSNDYDDALKMLLKVEPHAEPAVLYERLIVEDGQMAADVFRGVYDRTGGADGFVSLEVSPYLAGDTAGTIAEARRLWKDTNRPNLMIKVPATREGIPAIETLIAEGINVNITLMFSLGHYDAVAGAYLRGLARLTDPSRVASVASFFVSRVDTPVDRALETLGERDALALRGKIAIANAKLAYRRFREIFYGQAFEALRRRGARVQRPLWASTGTKDPNYSDVLYVEELIGPDTVNTVPPATLNAFRDHGRVRGATVQEDVSGAEHAISRLKDFGIDLDAITEQLQVDGVDAFKKSLDHLYATLDGKRSMIVRGQVDVQQMNLGTDQTRVSARVRTWHQAQFLRRLWAKDYTLWSPALVPEITDRLGWLTLPETMTEHLDDLVSFANDVKAAGVRHVVLLGMGGSSLAPEVFHHTFGPAAGYPGLIVLDSTHPAAVRAVESQIDVNETLFLVSSKSGTTTETLSLFRYFWQRAARVSAKPGERFVAITDPDTPLVTLARDRDFRRTFPAPPDVGGRYSALTVFGLVPAALIGADVRRLLDRAWRMAEANAFCVSCAESPGLTLGAALGELTLAGRDKITFFVSPSLDGLPLWIEQLIAESTGKDGKGIIPVVDEPVVPPEHYGSDRFFVYVKLLGDETHDLDARVGRLERSGQPVARIMVMEKVDLGQEYFRWEVAVASAGAALGIHPFNQPDVQLAKDLAHQTITKGSGSGGRPAQGDGAEIFAARPEALAQSLRAWTARIRPGDYVGVQAYLSPSDQTASALRAIRTALLDRLRVATTLGYGPRFLHSTGQLHKGGPNTGVYLQIIDDPEDDVPVPETNYTFGALIRAQALGDLHAREQRGRRVLRVNLGRDVAGGLRRMAEALRA